MAVSTPAFESFNEFNTALAHEIDEVFQFASISARQTIGSATANPITAITSSNIVGIIAAGGAQRNFTITTSITETPGATPNTGVVTD